MQFTGSTTQVRIQEILKFLIRITSDNKELDKRKNQIQRWMKADSKLAALSRYNLETSAFEGTQGRVEGRFKAVQHSTPATKADGLLYKPAAYRAGFH